MSKRDAAIAILAAAILAACAGKPATVAPAPAGRGWLFIVGGGPQPPELVQRFVDLAGGRGHARIIIFAMASGEAQAGGDEKAVELRDLGAVAQNVVLTHDQANTDSAARLLDSVTGIWFGGGDQVLLTNALRATKVEQAIHARYAAGAVIGGTSAGAAVMSTPMITGDELHPGGSRPPDDSTNHFLTIARGDVITDEGFALIEGAVIDQHFLRRKRHNRLMSVVLERPPHLGVGIDESTALLVHPDGHWSILGASAAVVYDARKAVVGPGAPLGATGITVHILPAGSSFDPVTGKAVLKPEGQASQ